MAGGQLLRAYIPDVFIGIRSNNPTRLKELSFHEISHASHYLNSLNTYWETLIWNEIGAWFDIKDTWGDKNSVDAEQIAICEGWAEFLGKYYYPDKYYGSSVFPRYIQRLELTKMIN